MSNYTPTTTTIRAEYAGRVEAWEMTYAEQEAARAEEVVEFDRWLRAHDAQVAAQALREAADEAERHADEGCPSCSNNPVSACSGANKLTAAWLRSRAEQTKEDR